MVGKVTPDTMMSASRYLLSWVTANTAVRTMNCWQRLMHWEIKRPHSLPMRQWNGAIKL
jgi:hypothetical protein